MWGSQGRGRGWAHAGISPQQALYCRVMWWERPQWRSLGIEDDRWRECAGGCHRGRGLGASCSKYCIIRTCYDSLPALLMALGNKDRRVAQGEVGVGAARTCHLLWRWGGALWSELRPDLWLWDGCSCTKAACHPLSCRPARGTRVLKPSREGTEGDPNLEFFLLCWWGLPCPMQHPCQTSVVLNMFPLITSGPDSRRLARGKIEL